MILVTGATGTVGRILTDQLLLAGALVRVITRRRANVNLPAGVDIVRADLGDPGSLPTALTGVDQVFLLSNGPQIPEHDSNIAVAAARAGTTRIVKLSVARAAEATASDPLARWHRAGEQAVRDSGLDWTFLRSVGFMSNALHWTNSIRTENTVYAPYGDHRNAVIDPHDIATVAAVVLTTQGHEQQAYRLTGPEAISPVEQTNVLADVLRRPLRFIQVHPVRARQELVNRGISAEVADGIMAVRAAGLDDSLAIVHPTVERITGRPARSFRDWCQHHQADFMPSGSGTRPAEA